MLGKTPMSSVAATAALLVATRTSNNTSSSFFLRSSSRLLSSSSKTSHSSPFNCSAMSPVDQATASKGDQQQQQRSNMSTSSAAAEPTINLDNMNPCVKRMEYAVRGPLVIRANEIEKEIQSGVKKPFDDVIKANIGDAHAMGQEPITFLRQVLSLVAYPALLKSNEFPADAKERAQAILEGCKNGSVGSYSDSAGIEVIRRHAAEYIRQRDGGIDSNWENILLCAGASEGIRAVMKLIFNPQNDAPQGKKPGVMIPIPQYPLYSATIAEFNMHQIGYYLNEEKNWAMDMSELERSLAEAKQVCEPKAIVIINPGNPTGSVLSRENIENVVKFAHKEKLFVFADEVYQHNVYADGCAFHSFKKVMNEMGAPYNTMELASFMSTSKGYMGECGIRGGYAEICNVDPQVKAMLLKSVSAKLCPTVIGQACMDVIVNPPKEGEPSFPSYSQQKSEILAGLAERAKLVAETFNSMEGMSCNTVQGAMYAFPQLHLPPKAVAKAKENGQAADVFYAFQLLENTGICIIPGSGFGQRPGTYHFRTTILPQNDALISMMERLKSFHVKFMKEYS